ncbi:MAG: hypothetical protein ACK5KU_10670 [Beutenbergiaceae bacterium]
MRRILHAFIAMALAMLTLPVLAMSATPAQANPADCPAGAIASPLNFPSGTAVTVLNDFPATHTSAPPSTIRFGPANNPSENVLGVTTGDCVLNGLSYNNDDGYLYAFAEAEVNTAPTPGLSTLMRIGYDTANQMAIEQVAVLDASTLPEVEALTPYVADYSDMFDAVMLAGLGSSDPLQPDALQPSVISMPTNGGSPSAVTQSFDASCVPFLQNFVGGSIAYGLMSAALVAQSAPDGVVPPEGGLQDWAVNPADGMIYGYASVDARDSSYTSPFQPVGPYLPPVGVTPTATHSYVGLQVDIPALSWLPAGVAGPYTIERQSDWVLRIDPADGATTCAAAGAASDSGAINLGNGLSANDPVYDGTGAFVPGSGGVEIAGSGFTSATAMQLFDVEQQRHFELDISTCSFASTTPSCVVTSVGSMGLTRSRGDGAGYYHHLLPVVPAAPTLVLPTECAVEATVSVPEVTGVSYTSARTGAVLRVVATPLAGYTFPPGTTSEWSFDIPAVQSCPTDPATTSSAPPVPAASTPERIADTGLTPATPILSGLGFALILAGILVLAVRRQLARQ